MLETVLHIVLGLLMLSILLILIRLTIGPTLPDRVIALDLLVSVTIGIICAYSILYNKTIYIDVAVILALIAFLGTVSFAYYYEKGLKK